jgi:hypothetical protein
MKRWLSYNFDVTQRYQSVSLVFIFVPLCCTVCNHNNVSLELREDRNTQAEYRRVKVLTVSDVQCYRPALLQVST